MKALVTGSSGFLGTHLCRRLEQLEYQVVPFERIWWFGLDFDDLRKKMQEIKPDFIFHLAAFGNHYHQKDHQQIFMANVFNTFQLLEATKDIPYQGFFNFGSSSEYGRKDEPMMETDFLEPDTFYGATKACSTLLARAYHKQFDKPIITIRPFSVYGPGEADFRFIPTVIKCLRFGETLPLTEGVHDWIYIDDFIDGVIKMVENVDKLRGKILNIGTGKQYSNKEIVDILEKITGYKIKTEINEQVKRSYDTQNWVADNSLLKSLGWEQKYSLEEGLRATYESTKKTNPRN